MVFRDRFDAGRQLARRLDSLRGSDVVVLGLPRGGVPVAFEVARQLGAPLDVIVVRKLGLPSQPELAMGAIGEGGTRVLNTEVIVMEEVSDVDLARVERRERSLVDARVVAMRRARSRVALEGRTVVVVDDGMATGSTALAACRVARLQGAAKIILAVPVAPRASLGLLAGEADQVVCLEVPKDFLAVGDSYLDFKPTSDREVVVLLRRALETAGEPHLEGPPGSGHLRNVDGDVAGRTDREWSDSGE